MARRVREMGSPSIAPMAAPMAPMAGPVKRSRMKPAKPASGTPGGSASSLNKSASSGGPAPVGAAGRIAGGAAGTLLNSGLKK